MAAKRAAWKAVESENFEVDLLEIRLVVQMENAMVA